MNIPEPDDIAESCNDLAWEHLNRLAECGTSTPDYTLNVDPEGLLVFIAIIGAKKRNHTNPRIIQESVTWGRNFQNELSKSRYDSVTKFLTDEASQIRERAEEYKSVIFNDGTTYADLEINDTRKYEDQESKKLSQVNNRLFLRNLFGNIPRAEIVNYLIHGGNGNSHEIHRKINVNQQWVHRHLVQLERTDFVTAKKDGRQLIHRWSSNQQLVPNEPEKWTHWCKIYDALLRIHKQTIVKNSNELSDYQKQHIKGEIDQIIRSCAEDNHVDAEIFEQIDNNLSLESNDAEETIQ